MIEHNAFLFVNFSFAQGVENILKTVNVVVESDKKIIAESEIKTQSSTKLVKNLEKLTQVIAKVVTETKEPFAVFGTNTALVVKYVTLFDL